MRQPEGNGVAERFVRTLKENLLWVRHFETIEELRLALLDFGAWYNTHWLVARHGPLGTRGRSAVHSPCPRQVNRLLGVSDSLEGAPVQLPEGSICRMEDKAVAVGHQLTGIPAKNLDLTSVHTEDGTCSDKKSSGALIRNVWQTAGSLRSSGSIYQLVACRCGCGPRGSRRWSRNSG